MATSQDYIKRFFAGMQQRNRVLLDKLSNKQKIDERIKQRGKIRDIDIARLTALIGEDSKARKGKLEDQSIRYLLWKSAKSADFLAKWKNRLTQEIYTGFNPAKETDKEIAEELESYLDWISEQLLNIKLYATEFEEIYEQEIKYLASTQTVTGYLQNVKQEEILLTASTEFRDKLIEKAKPRMNKILYLTKKNPATAVFAAFMAFTFVCLPLLPGSFAPKSEEIPLFPIFAAIATVLYATTKGKNILSDIQATLERLQKEVWTD
ncbi:hypothetical protein GF343_03370 [Candidatus Woesearchaeota archaeon]|nr:hypothetical protein [Candidatus Woesearchaeota archaeon]